MFCQKCGNQLNEGAVFCPKCGTRIDIPSSIRVEAVNENSAKPVKPKKKKRVIIVSIILVLCLLCFIVGISSSKSVNAGKGADDPAAIGQAFVLCCQYRDTSYLDQYFDEEFKADSFIAQMQDFLQTMDEQNFGDINMSGVTCELGATYEEDGYTCVDMTVNFAEEGLFGGNTIFGNRRELVISLHRANTPDGTRWFIGKPKSSYYNDETGLMAN